MLVVTFQRGDDQTGVKLQQGVEKLEIFLVDGTRYLVVGTWYLVPKASLWEKTGVWRSANNY